MALHPMYYRQLLHVPELRALDLFGMIRSEDHTGFYLGQVLPGLHNLKVCHCLHKK